MHSNFINEIPPDKFSLIDQIGSGTFSDIFSATHIKTNTKIALKVSLKTNTEEYDKMLDQEVKISQSLHHPFICKYFYEFETEHLNIIVMELIEGTTVLDYVNQGHGIALTEVKNVFTQLLIAIEYLHDEAHITHRDLKLENIMIDNCGHIRLIDFGFSSKKSMMSTLCGSIPYCAPEVLSGQLYTKESDIWSMGIILYSLFDGNLPFYHSNTNTLAKLICNTDVKFPPNFNDSLKDLITQMLDKNPSTRIKIEDIKQHPFLSQEKLLLLDYKQLFSPIEPKQATHLQKNPTATIKTTTKLNSSSQFRKSGTFRSTSSAFNMSSEAQEILHEKITMKTDDIDLSIENRKDFAYNLTKLIQGAVLAQTLAKEGDNSNSQFVHLGAHMAGTSDLATQAGHNHHFVLTNHFAGMTPNMQQQPVGELKEGGGRSGEQDTEAHQTHHSVHHRIASPNNYLLNQHFNHGELIRHSNSSSNDHINHSNNHHNNSTHDSNSPSTDNPIHLIHHSHSPVNLPGSDHPAPLARRRSSGIGGRPVSILHHSRSPTSLIHFYNSPLGDHPTNSIHQLSSPEIYLKELDNLPPGCLKMLSKSNSGSDSNVSLASQQPSSAFVCPPKLFMHKLHRRSLQANPFNPQPQIKTPVPQQPDANMS